MSASPPPHPPNRSCRAKRIWGWMELSMCCLVHRRRLNSALGGRRKEWGLYPAGVAGFGLRGDGLHTPLPAPRAPML